MTKKQVVSVDFERLEGLGYDKQEMALTIASAIDLGDSTRGTVSQYTDADRIMAVAIYVVVGTYRGAARVCGISAKTLCEWGRNADWWADALSQTREINSALLNARSTSIINKAMTKIEERLDLGDPYIDKNQQVSYMPVSVKSAAIVYGVVFDKMRINNSLATHISQSNVSHLVDIKAQFDTMTGTRVIEGDTVTSE